jgi:hypothetical protein
MSTMLAKVALAVNGPKTMAFRAAEGYGLLHDHQEQPMEKIEVILTKAKETKGTYVYEEDIGDGGKPLVLKTQYIQKWVLGSNPPEKIKVTIEAV